MATTPMMDETCENTQINDTEELVMFREQWKAELQKEQKSNSQEQKSTSQEQLEQLSQAEELYWMGVSAEENKDMSAAILYYRQAVQLVPDIDKRVTVKESHNTAYEDERMLVEEDNDETLLSNCLSSISLTENDIKYCLPSSPSKHTHISVLPIEILKYIVTLAVINDLDLRSLEQFGMVCKRFYVISRDEFFWRKACKRLWNEIDCHSDWRHLYITKPHLHFNGVYISRSTYVRAGEQSLDHLYKPFHTVIYYRYLRFFADGTVLYLTSPDNPLSVVNKLNVNKFNSAIHKGYYTHSNDYILVVVNQSEDPSPRTYRRRINTSSNNSVTCQKFHMELYLKHSSRKLSSQLNWKSFSCHNIQNSTGHIQVTDFELNYTYTPFFFSRVKSYSLIHSK